MGSKASSMLAVSASIVLQATLAAQIVEVEEITAPPGVFDFGGSLSLSGERVAVGAPSHNSENDQPGAVYVLERQKSVGWLQTAFIQPVDGGGADAFGRRIALAGQRLLASTPWPGSDCGDCTLPPPVTHLFERDALGAWSEAARFTCAPGAVYVFERQSGAWLQTAKLKPSDASANDFFGAALLQIGNEVLGGAIGGDSNALPISLVP